MMRAKFMLMAALLIPALASAAWYTPNRIRTYYHPDYTSAVTKDSTFSLAGGVTDTVTVYIDPAKDMGASIWLSYTGDAGMDTVVTCAIQAYTDSIAAYISVFSTGDSLYIPINGAAGALQGGNINLDVAATGTVLRCIISNPNQAADSLTLGRLWVDRLRFQR